MIEEIEHNVQKVGTMDLRKKNTILRIKNGFKQLIKDMNYSSITVQDIIEKSEIGRTTFYMHFNSKDDVLKSIVTDIFFHINTPDEKLNHNYASDNSFLSLINHMLYHFKDEKELLQSILKSESHDIFLNTLKEHQDVLIKERMVPFYYADNVPEDILLNHLSSSLTEIILWWICKNNCNDAPEEISYYYFSLIMPALTTKGFSYTISDKIKKIS